MFRKAKISSVEEVREGLVVKDWLTGEPIGKITRVVLESEKPVAVEITSGEGPIVEYPLSQLKVHDGELYLLPSWLHEAITTLQNMKRVYAHVKKLKELVDSGKIAREVHEDVLRTYIGGAFSALDKAEKMKKTIAKNLEELNQRIKEEKEMVIDMAVKRILEDVDMKEYVKEIERMRELRKLRNMQLNDLKTVLDELDKTLKGIYKCVFPEESGI